MLFRSVLVQRVLFRSPAPQFPANAPVAALAACLFECTPCQDPRSCLASCAGLQGTEKPARRRRAGLVIPWISGSAFRMIGSGVPHTGVNLVAVIAPAFGAVGNGIFPGLTVMRPHVPLLSVRCRLSVVTLHAALKRRTVLVPERTAVLRLP